MRPETAQIVDIRKIVGKGYNRFWNFKGRYRVVKGSRGSKKSTTTSLWYIANIAKYSEANLLVVRKVYNTHSKSTFEQLKWAIKKLQVEHLWNCTTHPLEMTYKPTGQKIIFRGLDDPMNLTSLTVSTGVLCWVWWEEAYQITNEDDFQKVDMSIRGQMPPGLFKQHTLTFNPWSAKHWLKKRFFDIKDPNILALTTNYLINEFLDDEDLKVFDWLKEYRPREYKVAGLGEWGIPEGAIFDYLERQFDINEVIKSISNPIAANGLDFGYKVDPTAFIATVVDEKERKIYIYDQHYERGMLNDKIALMIHYKGFGKEKIRADSAEPKSIEEIKRGNPRAGVPGVPHIEPAEKGKDSIMNGIQFIQQFQIIVHPSCSDVMIELDNYVWATDKKTGVTINEPIDEYNHLMDAFRYAMELVKAKKTIQAKSRPF